MAQQTATRKLLRVQDVSELTGYSVAHIYLLARNGTIPARKIGTSVRFLPADLEAWIAGLPKAGE